MASLEDVYPWFTQRNVITLFMHVAAENASVEILQELIEQGGDIEIRWRFKTY